MKNEIDVIMAVAPTPDGEREHAVPDLGLATFTWDYQKGRRAALAKLYEKAKRSQWNAETDIDWSIDVDPE